MVLYHQQCLKNYYQFFQESCKWINSSWTYGKIYYTQSKYFHLKNIGVVWSEITIKETVSYMILFAKKEFNDFFC